MYKNCTGWYQNHDNLLQLYVWSETSHMIQHNHSRPKLTIRSAKRPKTLTRLSNFEEWISYVAKSGSSVMKHAQP